VKNITIVLTGYAARAFASIDVATRIPSMRSADRFPICSDSSCLESSLLEGDAKYFTMIKCVIIIHKNPAINIVTLS
jgi:hypothetical protein